ncbi:MAG TPA: ABC transporter ATP-binding protein [Firmicutes bacterium]|nr:ABC transporter ATP-binding protein [Bacillota bacterium]
MLELSDLHVYYGGIHALKGVSIRVPAGSVVTLIGANGAGKTTMLKTISGLVRPKSGAIKLHGEDITGEPAQKIVNKGIALVPEGRRIFRNLSVIENLMMGAYQRKDRKAVAEDLEWVFSLFPRLKERRKQKGGTLSGGEQQMLAIGRALMSSPTVLALDEPSLGLAPLLVQEVFEILKQIHDQGKTILLVEQNAKAALKLADYAYVIETGTIPIKGTGQELLENDSVRAAYLGEQ